MGLYVAAGVSYILAGLAWKGLLNWIVGPLWLILFVAAAERIRQWRGRAT